MSEGMSICKHCVHVRRGRAVDVRPAVEGFPPPPPRPRCDRGDYICSARGLTRELRSSVDGSGGALSGPDCRDLNPTGECLDFRVSWSRAHDSVIQIVAPLVIAALLVGGVLLIVLGS